MELKEHGDIIIELGITKPEMGGSEYYEYVHNFTGGLVPKVNFITEGKIQKLVLELIKKGLADSVNDCSEGGLALALVEMSILGEKGINIDLNNVISECNRIDDVLFSESHSRMIISTNRNYVNKILDLARNYGVPCSIIGTVKNDDISINISKKEIISLTLADISKVWGDVIPKCMGEVN
jgi:phosphoribosylformylglycinamidine synthase